MTHERHGHCTPLHVRLTVQYGVTWNARAVIAAALLPTPRYDWTEEEIHQLITNKGLALDPKNHGAVVENPLAAQVCWPCRMGR